MAIVAEHNQPGVFQMRQSHVAAEPTKTNIIQYVFDKLYFQGKPCEELHGVKIHQDSPHLAKSAIGHLIPVKILHKVTAEMKGADIYKMVRELRPESAGIFAPENQRLILKLEKISRAVPAEGVPYRTFLREAFKPLLPAPEMATEELKEAA
jgi:hypothetical protein